MGKVEFKRAYYQCQREEEQKGEKEEQKQHCSGRAPADQIWGIDQRRTTPGVQEAVGYLCARLTFEEAAQALNVTSRTLKRDWEAAKKWLYRDLRDQKPPSAGA